MKKLTAMALVGSMTSALALKAAAMTNRIFGFDNIKRHLQSQPRNYLCGNSIAKGNRHGGAHEHKREIARNQRRATRHA